jgi:ATP-dependent protease ClpP protease subunit
VVVVVNKILEFKSKDKEGKEKSVGRMEIKNMTSGSAELYFFGDIVGSTWDAWQSEDMCPQDVAVFLNGLNGVQNIDIYINSGGGDSFAGIAIYNMLKRNQASKTVYVIGLAASAASLIALSGDKLIVYSGAQLMIHNPWTYAMGNANDFRKVLGMLDKASESYANIYAEHAIEGITSDEIKQKMDAETWMTGRDASLFFNNVEVENIQVAACAGSQFYSRYKHMPESLKQKQEDDGGLDDTEAALRQAEIKQLSAKLALELEL